MLKKILSLFLKPGAPAPRAGNAGDRPLSASSSSETARSVTVPVDQPPSASVSSDQLPTRSLGERPPQIARPLKERVLSMQVVNVGRGPFDQAIVGESNYQSALQRVKREAFIAIGEQPVATFLVAREPENPYDHDAIAVLAESGDVVGYLSREDARQLQPTVLTHEERGEVLACSGKIFGDDMIGVWLNLPHLSEQRANESRQRANVQPTPESPPPAFENLDVCRDVLNVAGLVEGHKPYGRSRPNWVGSRIAAIGEERYLANLELVSKGRCEKGERITLKVLLIPDAGNPVDGAAVMITTVRGDVLGYLSKAHAERWGRGVKAFFESGRVVCREAGLHQRTFKSGKRTFYLAVDMTDEEWLEDAADK